jgi:hypothetical protein
MGQVLSFRHFIALINYSILVLCVTGCSSLQGNYFEAAVTVGRTSEWHK